MPSELDLKTLQDVVAGTAAAFRCVTHYQPVGGPGDKVFPPTYEGGKYATEKRIDPATGELRQCVLLDSVQSQANRMELALLEAHRAGKISLPLLVTQFDQEELPKPFSVSSLEAPHRAADALFRDSLLDGVIFRKSAVGRILDTAGIRSATGLFGLCPTALVFGLWDSTGPRGGLGAKFQRALVSEIVGFDAVAGVKTASRIDPAQIMRNAAVLNRRDEESEQAPDWSLEGGGARFGSGRNPTGRPSEANHGNVTPTISVGGFTVSSAQQTTTLSLAVLRRLKFPVNRDGDSAREVDVAARTVLAALGLAAGALARVDVDLRSRCHLFAEQESLWHLLDHPGQTPQEFQLDPDVALELLSDAIDASRSHGLPWKGEIALVPSPELVELVRRSQELALEPGADDA